MREHHLILRSEGVELVRSAHERTARKGGGLGGNLLCKTLGCVQACSNRRPAESKTIKGFKFPHVRGVEGGSLTLAMGVSRSGIDWDGTKVHLVFLSAIPVAVSAFYLRMMSALAQAFNKPANREAAFAAEDQSSLWKALVRATRTVLK